MAATGSSDTPVLRSLLAEPASIPPLNGINKWPDARGQRGGMAMEKAGSAPSWPFSQVTPWCRECRPDKRSFSGKVPPTLARPRNPRPWFCLRCCSCLRNIWAAGFQPHAVKDLAANARPILYLPPSARSTTRAPNGAGSVALRNDTQLLHRYAI